MILMKAINYDVNFFSFHPNIRIFVIYHSEKQINNNVDRIKEYIKL